MLFGDRVMRLKAIILLVVFFTPVVQAAGSLFGEHGNYSLAGSYKNLLTVSETPVSRDGFWSDLNRIRLRFDADVNDSIRFSTSIDNEFLAGTLLDRRDFNLVKDASTDTLLDLDHLVVDSEDLLWQASIYRMYLTYTAEKSKLVLGRQRVAWGVGRVWNPFDLFNPISPLQIEQDQRVGVDAVNLEYYTGSLSSLNLVFAAGDDSDQNSIGLKGTANINKYDLHLMAGEFRENRVVGFGFTGDLNGAGLRGEATYTDPDAGNDYWQAILGWDYSFKNPLYVMFEYLYNGGNVKRPAAPGGFTLESNRRIFSGEIETRNSNFLASGLAYDITPLVQVGSLLIYDIDGSSVFFAPTLAYNILPDLDWTLGVQLFSGSERSEYGDLPDVYYTSLEWFF